MAASIRIPPLSSLRAFEAFCRHGLVREAADELSISHTVVSRHIQNLELYLGVKLVKKSGRNLILTPEGKKFSEQLIQAFGIMAHAVAGLQRGSNEVLHIACMAGFASRRLLGMLSDMEAALGISQVLLEPNLVGQGLLRGQADVELAYYETYEPLPGLRTEIFATPRIVPVASPAFMEKHGPVECLEDLVKLPLIHEKSTGLWQRWLRKAGLESVPPLTGVDLWHGNMTLDGARIGRGVALVSELIAAPSLQTGELVEVLPPNIHHGAYYITATNELWKSAKVKNLKKWLEATFG